MNPAATVGLALLMSVMLAAGLGLSAPSVRAGVGLEHHAVGWYSSNWSGYVKRSTTFTSVSGQWTVPSVSTSSSGFSAIWVGVGGVSENELIQVGTEQDSLYGRAYYNAWWEILPAPAVEITAFRVRPGDHITATVSRVSGSTWRITIVDVGHGSFSITRTFHGDGSSAEWIVEAPVVGRHIAQLARFSQITFDHLKANGRNPLLTSSQSGALYQGGVRVATPSVPDSERDGFAVRRSSTAPPAP
jgi:hypothetical protein